MKKTTGMDRRSFIKKTATAGAAAALGPQALLRGAEEPRPSGGEKSRVIEVSAPGAVTLGKRLDEDRVKKMVERGMLALTGKKDTASAWRCFVKPDDVVGIKLNSGGGRLISSKESILETVYNGVLAAGVPMKNIIVWDQVEETLHKYYVKKMRGELAEKDVVFKGCTPALREENYMGGKPLSGFDTEPQKFSWGQVKVAELVANELTAIINIPVLKDHACSGVTGALKNISHAVVDIPWLCHANCCDPHIADINNIACVRDKLRLHILDGLFGVADGGPQLMSMNHLFEHEKILLSADPVAVDMIVHEWIVKARKDMGFVPLEEAPNRAEGGKKGRPAKHIATAAARGLGTNDPKRMDLVKVDMPAPPEPEEDSGESKGSDEG